MRLTNFRPDRAAVIGLLLSAGSILGATSLEGARISDLLQLPAALIVLGGTAGAVLVTCSPQIMRRALVSAGSILHQAPLRAEALIETLMACSQKARKQGLLSLETEADSLHDPFLRKALNLAVDGAGSDSIRENIEVEITLEESRLEDEARVFEAAGGYAPTVGIVGAVLGLIQVMKHLDNIGQVGHGIAAAFVSTVYGVGLSNLVLLPIAGKLRFLAAERIRLRELTLEGVLGIAEGRNPRLIRGKLEAYLPEAPHPLPAPARAFIVKQAAR